MVIATNLYGRLGNQLFQYATLRSISLNKNDCDIYYNTNFIWHEQECKLKYFNLKKSTSHFNKEYIFNQKYNDKSLIQEGSSSTFNEEIFNIKDHTLIDGHFINEKYFYQHREIIKNEISLIKPLEEECNKIINSIYLNNNNCKIIGIHLRRGDSVSQGLFDFDECNQFINKCLEMIKKIDSNIYLLFFSGGSTSRRTDNWINNTHEDDINFMKRYSAKFSIKNEISIGTLQNNELIDFGLFSKCDYNIIPFLSTFSWWSAYVNKKNDKKVFVNKKSTVAVPKKFICVD